jgi:hypothetical protein
VHLGWNRQFHHDQGQCTIHRHSSREASCGWTQHQNKVTKFNTVTCMGFGFMTGFMGPLDTQLMATLYSSLLHTHKCPQSCLHCRCFVAASNGGRSRLLAAAAAHNDSPSTPPTDCNC